MGFKIRYEGLGHEHRDIEKHPSKMLDMIQGVECTKVAHQIFIIVIHQVSQVISSQ